MDASTLYGPLLSQAPSTPAPAPTPPANQPITSVAQVPATGPDLTDEQKQQIANTYGLGEGSGSLTDQLGTGAYSAINGATFGIPDLIMKTMSSPTYQAILAGRKRNQLANAVGNTGGTVASMFVPAFGLAGKGLEAGAKGLDALGSVGATKVADVLGGASDALNGAHDFLNSTGPLTQAGTGLPEIIAQAGKGVAQAATQAVPRALTDYGTTGNFDPASLGLQLAAGGVLGGAGSGLSQLATGDNVIGRLVNSTKEGLSKGNTNAILSGADVNTGILTKAMNQTAKQLGLDRYGNMFNNADEFRENIANFIVKNNLQDKLTREQFLDDQGPLWQGVTDKYNASPLNVQTPEFAQDFLSSPEIQTFINNPRVGLQGIQKIAGELSNGIVDDAGQIADFNSAKQFLSKESNNANKALNNTSDLDDQAGLQARQAVADTLKNSIDQHALSLDPSYADLKANYPIIKVLKMASGKEQIKVDNPIMEGSPTQKNLEAGELIKNSTGLLGGALTGGALGATSMDDEHKWLGGAGGALVGLAGGAGLASGFGKGLTQEWARVAGRLRNNNLISNLGSALASKASTVPAVGASLAQNASLTAPDASQTGTNNSSIMNPEAPTLSATPPAQASNNAPTAAPVQGTNASSTPAQSAPTNPMAGMHPQMQNPTYRASVLNRLQTVYSTDKELQMSGISFPDFARQIQVHTNGFDPRFMGKVFYDNPEMQSKYQKDVTLAQQLKSLPVNDIINDTYNPVAFMIPEKSLNAQKLQALLNNGKDMAKPEREALETNLRRIATLPASQKGPAFLSLLKSNYGIDLPSLNSLGAY